MNMIFLLNAKTMSGRITDLENIKILCKLYCELNKIHNISDKLYLDAGEISIYNSRKTHFIYVLWVFVIDGSICCKDIKARTYVNGDINYLNSCYAEVDRVDSGQPIGQI